MQSDSLEDQKPKALALLLFMNCALTAREIGTTLNLSESETDTVLADLITQGFVTSRATLFTRRKVYSLSREGEHLLDQARTRVEALIGDTQEEHAA